MPIYTYSFLGLGSSSLIWLLPLLISLKVICSCKVPVSFFSQTSPSLTYIFWCRNLGGWGSFSFSTASSSESGSLPSSLSRPAFQDLLCLREQYKSCFRALLVFHVPQGILFSLSLPLFSTLSVPQDWPTLGQRALAIPPPSIHHEFSPDPVAQVSWEGTLGFHRLSFFPGSQGTLRPKGPLGRYLGNAPPSFRVSLSLCSVKRLGDDLFSWSDSH